MLDQILKEKIPDEYFYTFLKNTCTKPKNGFWIFSIDNYRKSLYTNILETFLYNITPYYHTSKAYYINRNQKYSKFTTILRHVCRSLEIPFTTEIKYLNNTYYIIYYIKNIWDLEKELS